METHQKLVLMQNCKCIARFSMTILTKAVTINPNVVFAAFAIQMLGVGSPANGADGNAERGQRVYGACVACHSLEPDRNITGPSLSGLWNRRSGSLPSFPRYSPALKESNVVWTDSTLDEWIKDPQHLIPGNQMTFAGIKNSSQRADLLAFLKQAMEPWPQSGSQSGKCRPQ